MGRNSCSVFRSEVKEGEALRVGLWLASFEKEKDVELTVVEAGGIGKQKFFFK